MTADQVKGKGFKGALSYNLKKLEQGVATVLDRSFAEINLESILKEVSLVKMLRPNLKKYFYHTSLNFPPTENLADEKIKKISVEYLNEMGFNQHQYIIFRHFDADHPHLHILVNRISYDGAVVSDSNDFMRSEKVLRRLEKKYKLTEVISSRQAQERAMTKNELEMMKRTDEPSVKMKLQVLIKGLVREKITTAEFIQRLESKGIDVLFNQASTGFVSGISYGYEGLQFKGAHLGNSYKWQAIKAAIGYEQERDRAAIYQANLRTRTDWGERGAAGSGAGANRVGANENATERDTGSLQQGAGELQEQIRTANRNDHGQASKAGGGDGSTQVPDQGVGGQRGTAGQYTKQDSGKVDHPALPDLHLSRVLLGADDAAGIVDQGALNEFKRKRTTKKKLKI